MLRITFDIRSIEWSNVDPVEGVLRSNDYVKSLHLPDSYEGVVLFVNDTDFFHLEEQLKDFLIDDTGWAPYYFTFTITEKVTSMPLPH